MDHQTTKISGYTVCCLYRVWLSSDRATQQSMINYAEQYMKYGIKVMCTLAMRMNMWPNIFIIHRLVQWILTLAGQLVITTSSLIWTSILMLQKWWVCVSN